MDTVDELRVARVPEGRGVPAQGHAPYPPVVSPSTWCPWLAPARTPHPCGSPTGTRTDARAGDDDRHEEAA